MILNDFLTIDPKGIYCRYGDFYIDPVLPVDKAVISHAHGDHAAKGNREVYCTAPTAAFMRLRYQKQAAAHFQQLEFNSIFQINGVQISFHPAGHILGSAQILLEYKGIRYLYTGDYKVQMDETCEPIEFVKCDVLITESTFADPQVTHPDPVAEICKFNSNKHNALLGAYSLGKAQRLINLITTYCPDRQVLVHHSIFPINKIYEAFGFGPGKYEMYNRKLMRSPDENMVYIVPPMTFNNYFRAKNVIRVFASGWNRLHTQNDLTMRISDHVDWEDILLTIERSKPREVWTLHGEGKHLRRHFEGKLNVKSLN